MVNIYSVNQTGIRAFIGVFPPVYNDVKWARYFASYDTTVWAGKVLSNVCAMIQVIAYSVPVEIRFRFGNDVLGSSANNPSSLANFVAHDDSPVAEHLDITGNGEYCTYFSADYINGSGHTDLRLSSINEAIPPPAVTYASCGIAQDGNPTVNYRPVIKALIIDPDIPNAQIIPTTQITPSVELTPEVFHNTSINPLWDAEISVDIDNSVPPPPSEL